MSVQENYQTHANPSELPEAEIIENNAQHAGKSCLVLQVSIEGRDQKILLAHDALQAADTGPAVVGELQKIAKALNGICRHIQGYRQNPDSKPMSDVPPVKTGTG
ncbi:MAG: hypothetical protein OXG16_12735 [Rhodospirillales bacterium]|nr:hypothetical protein [Rhodospirillales bacterium]